MTGMEMFIYAVVMLVVSYAITMSMQPKPQRPVAGQLDIPRASAGDNIGVWFGENVVKESNCVWYGDPKQKPIKTKGGKK